MFAPGRVKVETATGVGKNPEGAVGAAAVGAVAGAVEGGIATTRPRVGRATTMQR